MRTRFAPLALLALAISGCSIADRITGDDVLKELRKTGKPAEALVLAIVDTGMTVNGDPVVAFRLELRSPGQEPWEASTKARVGRLDVPRIQPGARLPALYDPKNPKQVALEIYRASI